MTGLRKEWAALIRAEQARRVAVRGHAGDRGLEAAFDRLHVSLQDLRKAVVGGRDDDLARWLAEAEDETDWRGLCERFVMAARERRGRRDQGDDWTWDEPELITEAEAALAKATEGGKRG